jgi:polyisoprenoid-binding protein YceI
MKHFILVAFAAFAFTSACKKSEDKPAPAPAGSAAATAPGSAAAPVPDTNADHITVLAHHQKPKPTDPVRLDFQKFQVVKAAFDPKKIEGGTATIEIDLASFDTHSGQRDAHVKSESYLDVGKFATATIDIDNVKQKAGTTYTADAKVTVHGQTKTYPVTFDVLETKDDSIKIKGQHTFQRLDFGVGTDPAQNPDESVAPDVTIEMVLTLKKS